MRWFYKLPLRFRSLLRKGRVEQELTDELRFHLGKLTEEYVAKGMTPEDARYTALRMLARSPGFTAVAVTMVALGIGVNAGIFTILNAAAFRPLPVANSGQLVSIYQTFRGNFSRNVYGAQSLFSYPEYREYRDQNKVFSGLLAYMHSVGATLGGVQPQQLSGTLTTCNYFAVLEARPQLGRGFVDADCAAPGKGAGAGRIRTSNSQLNRFTRPKWGTSRVNPTAMQAGEASCLRTGMQLPRR